MIVQTKALVPLVVPPVGLVDEISEYGRQHGWLSALSSNEKGECWLTTRDGNVPQEERIYLHGLSGFPFLRDVVVPEVLRHRATGARFEVRDDGVWMAKDRTCADRICVMAFTSLVPQWN